MDVMIEFLRTFGLLLALTMLTSALLAALVLFIAVRQARNINVPQDADFATTLHYTPFLVVLGIDLLDLGLDFLAAPLAWLLLDHMGLKALRGVSTVEALIPGTQFLPLLTAAWITVRVTGTGRPNVMKKS